MKLCALLSIIFTVCVGAETCFDISPDTCAQDSCPSNAQTVTVPAGKFDIRAKGNAVTVWTPDKTDGWGAVANYETDGSGVKAYRLWGWDNEADANANLPGSIIGQVILDKQSDLCWYLGDSPCSDNRGGVQSFCLEPNTDDFACPESNGLFPVQTCGSQFWQCSNNIPYLMDCASGGSQELCFMTETQQCDYCDKCEVEPTQTRVSAVAAEETCFDIPMDTCAKDACPSNGQTVTVPAGKFDIRAKGDAVTVWTPDKTDGWGAVANYQTDGSGVKAYRLLDWDNEASANSNLPGNVIGQVILSEQSDLCWYLGDSPCSDNRGGTQRFCLEPNTDDFACPAPNGNFPVQTCGSQYWACSNNIPYLMDCASGGSQDLCYMADVDYCDYCDKCEVVPETAQTVLADSGQTCFDVPMDACASDSCPSSAQTITVPAGKFDIRAKGDAVTKWSPDRADGWGAAINYATEGSGLKAYRLWNWDNQADADAELPGNIVGQVILSKQSDLCWFLQDSPCSDNRGGTQSFCLEPNTDDYACPESNGNFPVQTCGSQYWACSNNIPYLMDCASGGSQDLCYMADVDYCDYCDKCEDNNAPQAAPNALAASGNTCFDVPLNTCNRDTCPDNGQKVTVPAGKFDIRAQGDAISVWGYDKEDGWGAVANYQTDGSGVKAYRHWAWSNQADANANLPGTIIGQVILEEQSNLCWFLGDSPCDDNRGGTQTFCLEPNTDDFACPSANGLFPVQTCGSQFWQCSNHIPYLMDCASGGSVDLCFIAETGQCDYCDNCEVEPETATLAAPQRGGRRPGLGEDGINFGVFGGVTVVIVLGVAVGGFFVSRRRRYKFARIDTVEQFA